MTIMKNQDLNSSTDIYRSNLIRDFRKATTKGDFFPPSSLLIYGFLSRIKTQYHFQGATSARNYRGLGCASGGEITLQLNEFSKSKSRAS